MPRLREVLTTVPRGFLMGSADIVPGVSGGTVALVLGIYGRLIDTIHEGSSAVGHLLRGDVAGFRQRLGQVDWVFLISLLAGIGIAVLSLSHLVENLLNEHSVAMAGLFTGLVAGSAVIAWKLLTNRDGTRIAILVIATVATFVLLGLREATSTASDAEGSSHSLIIYFLAGAVAICAMILPGVSGSFLLVMLGMYASVIGVVNDRDLLAIAAFGLGCAVGIGLFSQVLHWGLEHHYNTIMAALVGLMIGSMRVLWPWPLGVDSTALGRPDGSVPAAVGLAVAAFVIVVGFDLVARRSSAAKIEASLSE